MSRSRLGLVRLVIRSAKARFGQVGDQVGQVKDQFGQGQSQELDNISRNLFYLLFGSASDTPTFNSKNFGKL